MGEPFNREDERSAVVAQLANVDSTRREQLIAEYRRRSVAAFAPETLRNYHQIIRSFSTWCEDNDLSPVPPVPPSTIATFVEAMGGTLSANTIETRLWAIAELHRSQFLASPCRHRLVELALKSVKRKFGAFSRQAPPLCKREVFEVLRNLGSTPIELRDKCLIWTASDSWCRVSELVQLRVKHLMRQDDGSSLLFIAKSKTDQYGEGDFAFLSEGGTNSVLEWIACAGLKDEDPIFTKSQKGGLRTPLDPASVSRIFKKRFGRNDVSSHSTRVGGVHDAFRLGCSMASIMVAGRWRSPEMPARYGRRILASQSAAAEVAHAFEESEAAEKHGS